MSDESTNTDVKTSSGTMADVEPIAGGEKPDPILIVDDVSKSFDGIEAVAVERLEVQRGTITALIGPNGAGKTTFFNVLTGFEKADRGKWAYDGEPMAGLPAYRVARHGMVRTFQLTKALARMKVIDNMTLAAVKQRGERLFGALIPPLWSAQEKENRERADELLARFKLDQMRNEYAATLSGGQRKLLEMARALMVSPTLIMLDEPMAGVNPALTQSLLEHVKGLRDSGMTVLFVEHDMDVVMGISDWIVVMAHGQIIAEGTPAAIASNDAVIDAYLGQRRGTQEKDE